jgi:hypothetical protein
VSSPRVIRKLYSQQEILEALVRDTIMDHEMQDATLAAYDVNAGHGQMMTFISSGGDLLQIRIEVVIPTKPQEQ